MDGQLLATSSLVGRGPLQVHILKYGGGKEYIYIGSSSQYHPAGPGRKPSTEAWKIHSWKAWSCGSSALKCGLSILASSLLGLDSLQMNFLSQNWSTRHVFSLKTLQFGKMWLKWQGHLFKQYAQDICCHYLVQINLTLRQMSLMDSSSKSDGQTDSDICLSSLQESLEGWTFPPTAGLCNRGTYLTSLSSALSLSQASRSLPSGTTCDSDVNPQIWFSSWGDDFFRI